MKRDVLFAIIVTVIIPALLIPFFRRREVPANESITKDNSVIIAETSNEITQIILQSEDGTQPMALEDYVLGVVLGEMPVQFHINALKAQAVVARTYACRSINHSKHQSANVCTLYSCCQAYMEPEDFLKAGGTASQLDKVRRAVEETKTQVLIYGGELIEATYFSCSGGRTEPAYAVWGADVPYLQAVDSPGEEISAHFTDTVKFTAQEFCDKIGMQLDGPAENWVEKISYTEGGGVASITLNGHTFSGTDIRLLLNLRSTAFIISAVGDTITVTTKGFGHRVGMSQYGAEAMAVQGSGYQEILFHYYSGTDLSTYPVDKDS